MHATKPYEFLWLGDMHGPKPYTCIGFPWAFISQTPVVPPGRKSDFRAGFRPDSNREIVTSTLRPAFGRPENLF